MRKRLMANVVQREPFRLEDLHPDMVEPTRLVTQTMRATVIEGHVLQPFEGYRSPMRQNYLFFGTKATKARAWKSGHQYGMAVDFAGLRVEDGLIIPNSWTWDVSEILWRDLKHVAAMHGLDVPIQWDRGHVIHPQMFKLFGIK